MKGFDMATSPDIYATTESRNKREDSPKDKLLPSSDSELLTPSEIESMKKDFEESEILLDQLVEEAFENGELLRKL